MLETEMADQLSELETTMVKSDIDLQNHISDLEVNCNFKRFQWWHKIDPHFLSITSNLKNTKLTLNLLWFLLIYIYPQC